MFLVQVSIADILLCVDDSSNYVELFREVSDIRGETAAVRLLDGAECLIVRVHDFLLNAEEGEVVSSVCLIRV